MSFSVNANGIIKIKRTLQVPRNILKRKGFKRNMIQCLQKRMRFSVLGSLTVEAAFVLPFFIMILSGIVWFGQVFYIQIRIQTALEQTGKEFASYYYAVKSYQDNGEADSGLQFIVGDFLGEITSSVAAKSRIKDLVGREFLDHSIIEGGSGGLSMWGSSLFQKEDLVDLTISYHIQIPYLNFLKPLSITQRSVRRAWTGKGGGISTQEEVVYITKNGSVYHTSLDCTYLTPSLREVSYENISEFRNESGEKFLPCEKCSEGKSDDFVKRVYVTKYGNRYHYSVACTALTHGIRSVKKSEIVGMPPCSKCTGEKK